MRQHNNNATHTPRRTTLLDRYIFAFIQPPTRAFIACSVASGAPKRVRACKAISDTYTQFSGTLQACVGRGGRGRRAGMRLWHRAHNTEPRRHDTQQQKKFNSAVSGLSSSTLPTFYGEVVSWFVRTHTHTRFFFSCARACEYASPHVLVIGFVLFMLCLLPLNREFKLNYETTASMQQNCAHQFGLDGSASASSAHRRRAKSAYAYHI